ncbi:hypothetical protein RvY_14872 [Ramazzottius varieornatus]|uniref:NYN domain-containing protein n=1 Tax=Ramazzottius varieornatus TaxID=947166 RepID=A0A1D1VSW2_RAMVA|nr:hypothetical protein RvY_14872 [Ramazzottius varieornatus]
MDRPGLQRPPSRDFGSSPPKAASVASFGQLRNSSSMAIAARTSASEDVDLGITIPSKRTRVSGRPARVFWDLENCCVGGRDYCSDIIRSIQGRVEADTSEDCFEIYAAYEHASHIPPDVYQELLAHDVLFSQADRHSAVKQDGSTSAVDDDLYEQVERYLTTQSPRTHLFPYVLLIAGGTRLMDKMLQLEKGAKVVYAIRKEKAPGFHASLGNRVVYEYSITKGIQNRLTLF